MQPPNKPVPVGSSLLFENLAALKREPSYQHSIVMEDEISRVVKHHAHTAGTVIYELQARIGKQLYHTEKFVEVWKITEVSTNRQFTRKTLQAILDDL